MDSIKISGKQSTKTGISLMEIPWRILHLYLFIG